LGNGHYKARGREKNEKRPLHYNQQRQLIKGEDAVWIDAPDTYKWELSNDDSNGTQKYVLWYEQANETTYTPIKKAKNGFGDLFIPNLGIGEGSSRKFGLKLKAPLADYAKDGIEYFYEGGEMETIVTISGVIA